MSIDSSAFEKEIQASDLRDADLRDADLRCADLSRADLRCADLSRADLRDADLSRAALCRADLSNANLSNANLRDADLSDADLCRADLRCAELSGAISFAPVTPASIELLIEVAGHALQEGALKMSDVHVCSTTHCGAGWTTHLSPNGPMLETLLGWNVAACILIPIPEFTRLFYSSKEKMSEFLESVLDDNGAALKAKYLLPISASSAV